MFTTEEDVTKKIIPTSVSAIALLCSSHLSAQETSFGLEEIVVTAQKRAESLQETPISITAFTAASMERMNITNIQQIGNFTPNLTFDFTSPISGASNAASIFIRGVGQSDFALTTEAGVGTYVDGIYMSRSVGGVLDVLDIERIEVLRGPQGTLFGRNTIGGAVNITSQQPNSEFGGFAEATIGNHGRLHLRSSVNLPISDTLFFRVSASSKDRNGYVRGLFAPGVTAFPDGGSSINSQTDFGNENRAAMRASLLWEAAPNFTVTVSADYTRIRENNAASILRGVTGGGDPAYGPATFFYNLFQAPGVTIPGFSNAEYSAANWVTGDLKSTYATGPNGSSIDAWGTSLVLEWEASDYLTIKSLTAYRKSDGYFNRDADGSPIDLTHTLNYDYQHKQFSQELQFIGNFADNRVKYAAGLYYFKEKGHDPIVVDLPASFATIYIDQADIDNSSIAGYAQATFAVTDAVGVTGGIRYTEDKKKFFTDQYLITGTQSMAIFGAPPGFVVPLVPRNSAESEKFTNWSPRLSLDVKVTDDLLTYASFSKGFKSGGFNMRYVQPRPEVLSFDPEKLTSYEVGFKWEGFDRRLRINGAAFYMDYTNIQVTTFESLGAPITDNAGKARIKGLELEISALPVENLQITGGLGYLDAQYKEINLPSGNFAVPEQLITLNSKLANAPKWQATAAIDYTVPLGTAGDLEFHIDWAYSGDIFNDAQNSIFLFQKSYHLLNAGIGYVAPDDRWRLRVFVDNLTDKRYIVSGDSNYGLGFHEANYNRPREFGASLRVNF